MTSRQRAEQVCNKIFRIGESTNVRDAVDWVEQAIIAAEEAKAKEEREASATIVKREIELWDREVVAELRESILHEIQIRARSEGEKKGE